MNRDLFLFCGGERYYDDRIIPKPLKKLKNGKSILEMYLSTVEGQFDSTYLLVEQKYVSDFTEVIADTLPSFGGNLRIVSTANGSRTLVKFQTALEKVTFENAYFSYPDLFIEPTFWANHNFAEMFIQITPVRTRFPRVYSSPFESTVKGVSSHASIMPANPHYIFAGCFGGSSEVIREAFTSFMASVAKEPRRGEPSFEVDFLDFCAGKKKLVRCQYYDTWIIADSERDYEAILSKPEFQN